MHNPTSGALCSVLLAMEYLQHDEELLVANADQYVDVSIDEFLTAARGGTWDGYLMTFPAAHPKWSYAKVEGDQVVAVAEKRPISRNATVGLYYFRSSRDFLAAAERMLLKKATVGGEFYVAPLYNELILMGKRVGIYPITREQMHSLGTPEDVEDFAATQAHVLNW
jgi:dTDP-glucose pyrophosphorylase